MANNLNKKTYVLMDTVSGLVILGVSVYFLMSGKVILASLTFLTFVYVVALVVVMLRRRKNF